MKYFNSILFVLFVIGASFAQEINTEATESGPIMTLENNVIEYGTVAQNSDPLRKVSFTNTGTAPLIIQSARGSCGCTVPTYPKEAIMPGEQKDIEIRYDTKRVGPFNKKVTITTNDLAGERSIIMV